MASDNEVEKCFALLRFLKGILKLLEFSNRALSLVFILILKAGNPNNIEQRATQGREWDDPPKES